MLTRRSFVALAATTGLAACAWPPTPTVGTQPCWRGRSRRSGASCEDGRAATRILIWPDHAASRSPGLKAEQALPPPIVISDPDGDSTLHPATGIGLRPLIYLSHRLGGEPELGRQNEAPWVLFGAMQRTGWTILRSADAGRETYGNDRALAYYARMCGKTIDRMDWDGQ